MELTHGQLLDRPHLALAPIRTLVPTRERVHGESFESALPAELTIPHELQGSDKTPAIAYDSLTAIAVVAVTFEHVYGLQRLASRSSSAARQVELQVVNKTDLRYQKNRAVRPVCARFAHLREPERTEELDVPPPHSEIWNHRLDDARDICRLLNRRSASVG